MKNHTVELICIVWPICSETYRLPQNYNMYVTKRKLIIPTVSAQCSYIKTSTTKYARCSSRTKVDHWTRLNITCAQ